MIQDLGGDISLENKSKLLFLLQDHEVEMKQHIYESVNQWNER